ncbi:MAG: hypothetical protein AAGD04_10545 [Pseudomonadota bacterium]
MPDFKIDATRFAPVAEKFSQEITNRIVDKLAEIGAISVSSSGMSIEDEDKVALILFNIFLGIEAVDGFDLGDKRYTAGLIFGEFPAGTRPADIPVTALSVLLTDKGTELHGGFASEAIQSAAKLAARP